MKKISCIIPAYNEEKNIKKILNIVSPLIWNILFEVIVINDCSTDNTKNIIKEFSKIIFIDNEVNLWKTKSLERWLKEAQGNYILLLDADLLNITKEDIIQLLEPVINDKADVTFSFRKNSWPLFPFKKIDYCTWERVIKKDLLLKIFEKEKNLLGYGFEVFMNKLIIKNKLRLQIIYWKNVENDFHDNKDGFIKGWRKNFEIWRDIIVSTGGIIQMYKMNIDLEKLLIESKK